MRSLFQKKSEEFLRYLEDIRGYSPLTIKTYKINLDEAIKYIDIEKDGKIYIINLIPYRKRLTSLKKRSVYKKVAIFRSFSTYFMEFGMELKLLGDDSIRSTQTLPKPISSTYIDEALKNCNIKERLIIYLFYALGLRISELASLKVKDIDQNWVNIKGKGAKMRQIPVIEELQIVLKDYIRQSGAKIYLFEKDHKALSENQIRYLVNKIFKKIGIKATPHQLRHSFASSLLNMGARVNDVSELLGHSSLSTTQIYTKLSATAKMRNYKGAHPLCRGEDELD